MGRHKLMALERRSSAAAIVGVVAVALLAVGTSPVPAAFPGDNGVISFSRLDRYSKLIGVEPDGSDRHVIYRTRLVYGPAWSPDGEWIAFTESDTFSAGFQWVAVAASDGSDHRRLTRRGWGDAAWTSFGRVLAVCAGPLCPRRSGIYSIDPFDRSDKRRIGGTYDAHDPVGSPTGARLAFVAKRGRQIDIFVKPLRRCCARRITNTNAWESSPDWAPEGRWIVFARRRRGDPDGHSDLFMIRVDGQRQRRLTRTAADETVPRFSPDGRFIVFSKSWGEGEDHRSFVYKMRRDGTHLRKVGRRDDDHGPGWQPIPE